MKLARKSALSRKVKTNSLMVVEDFSFDSPKTKDYQVFLNNLGINAKKTLLILPEVDKNLVLSARNLQKTHVALATHVDTYSLMNANKIVFLESAVGKIETLLNQA
jgi:large subunit ribosomal protein L4